MKFKKIILASMIFSLSIFTLTSCQYIQQFIDDNSPTVVKPTESDDSTETGTKPVTPTTNPEVPTTSNPSVTETSEVVELDEVATYGYNDLAKKTNGNKLTQLYTALYNECVDFSSSINDLSLTHKNFSNGTSGDFYIFSDDVCYSTYGVDFYTAAAVFKCVVLDHPEFYFVDNSILSHGNNIELVCDPDYKSATDRLTYNAKIEEYKETVKEAFTIFDTTPVKKIERIHDYIVKNAEYSFVTVGGVKQADSSSYAHNILGIILNKKGVCESYAKLFELLLHDNDIECILVTGKGFSSSSSEGEGHAWNYVRIDSEWYGFDVTWDDPIGGSSIIISKEYFGKVNSKFTNSHIPSTQGDLTSAYEYLYTLPTLADSNLDY